MKDEKKFLKPEAEIIEFSIDDIILTSGDPFQVYDENDPYSHLI